MIRMSTLIHETRDRVAFALEGVALGAEELLEAARDRAAVLLTGAACLLVVVALLLSGVGSSSGSDATASVTPPAPPEATVVEERGFALSLPVGWTEDEAPEGALYAASNEDGSARSVLWVERKPELSFGSYVASSLNGLQTLGTDAKIIDQTQGRSLEASSARLSAEVPLDGQAPGPYRVTLRAAGPYRYYLASSVAHDAPAGALAEAELLGGSLRPEPPAAGE
jgi:hypothetical protein